jgi:hypothetical protein
MKILHSVAIIGPIGDYGIGRCVYLLLEGLVADGVRLDVPGAEAEPRRRFPRRARYLRSNGM